ncbi:hypothetical protein ACGFMK_40460 [Amycolatopsis sp. NPDC049252]|uniref:hypothetical protein n=1 Tax=Amycolatopsis sp. NPDC049252 TaxID=3363933 RepID=UPI003723B986
MRALKDFVYGLYLRADAPTLDMLEAWIAADDDLAGAPDRATVGRIIGDTKVPPSQAGVVAVVVVLARATAMDTAHAAETARGLWQAAWMAAPIGKPLTEVTDPFVLEVHRPIVLDGADGLPDLPRYVRRPHDDRLDEIVARAADGKSAMAVLVAGSSAGKTRTCWEALGQLRAAGGWRLWHPYDPTRPEAALEALDQFGPRTVVWLNETQEYLKGDHGERVAAKVRTLLADTGRAPVLVLGTLWPEYHAELTGDAASQVRLVLDGTIVEVPEAFSGNELAELKESTSADARLAWAAEHADDGQITQCLAGGPALLERFYTAGPAAKAFIQVAMDAVRMGHHNALPRELLENAAEAYLTDTQLSQLEDNWQDQALADISAPCKGASGPVARIPMRANGRERRKRSTRQSESAEPLYRLADYLDQHSRVHRADLVPPIGFWTAAVAWAKPGSLTSLAMSAWNRGLFRDAAELNKRAASLGGAFAASQLVGQFQDIYPEDFRVAEWAVSQVALESPFGLATLLEKLHAIGAEGSLCTLASKAAASLPLQDSRGLGHFLKKLIQVGTSSQVESFLERDPASFVSMDNAGDVRSLLEVLLDIGATRQIELLLSRDPASRVAVGNSYSGAGDLITLLHKLEADDQVSKLAARAAAESPLLQAYAVANLLEKLDQAGCAGEVAVLLGRRPAAHVVVDLSTGADKLMVVLYGLGAREEVAVLASRAAGGVPISDGLAVAQLLQKLPAVGEGRQLTALLARDPGSHASLDRSISVGSLLSELFALGAREQAAVLAERAAAEIPLPNVSQVRYLLDILLEIRAHDAVRVLLGRDFISSSKLTGWFSGGGLMRRLYLLGARDQAVKLATRIVSDSPPVDPGALSYILESFNAVGVARKLDGSWGRRLGDSVLLDDPSAVAGLLKTLHDLGYGDEIEVLATRAAAGVPLWNSARISVLLKSFDELGLEEQISILLARDPAAGAAVAGGAYGIDSLFKVLRGLGQERQVSLLAHRVLAELDDARAGIERLRLLKALFDVGAEEEYAAVLQRWNASEVDLSDPSEVYEVLSTLRAVGAEEQIVALISRDPAGHVGMANPFGIANLLQTLQSLGANGQVEALAARAGSEVVIRSSHGLGMLLDQMTKVGAVGAVAALVARDPARNIVLGRYVSADFLLKKLHELGIDNQVTILADRLAAFARIDNTDTSTRLLEVLRAVGADDQADTLETRLKAAYVCNEEWNPADLAALTPMDVAEVVTAVDELPAAGQFGDFLRVGDHARRFRFGREPDGTPAEPWSWDDLA